jgi:hypothetical protein
MRALDAALALLRDASAALGARRAPPRAVAVVRPLLDRAHRLRDACRGWLPPAGWDAVSADVAGMARTVAGHEARVGAGAPVSAGRFQLDEGRSGSAMRRCATKGCGAAQVVMRRLVLLARVPIGALAGAQGGMCGGWGARQRLVSI